MEPVPNDQAFPFHVATETQLSCQPWNAQRWGAIAARVNEYIVLRTTGRGARQQHAIVQFLATVAMRCRSREDGSLEIEKQ